MPKDEPELELTPGLALNAYAAGVFPMADSARSDSIFWVDPKKRGILPLDALHVSRSLAKRIRRGDFVVTADQDFEQVIDGCAGRAETWINSGIRTLFVSLSRMGYAHSVETWADGELVGGLYGVALGGAFFGESMFSNRADASKVALVHLVERLNAGGFLLLDTQFVTAHLESLGAIEISRKAYHRRLEEALRTNADFHAIDDPAPAPPPVED